MLLAALALWLDECLTLSAMMQIADISFTLEDDEVEQVNDQHCSCGQACLCHCGSCHRCKGIGNPQIPTCVAIDAFPHHSLDVFLADEVSLVGATAGPDPHLHESSSQ